MLLNRGSGFWSMIPPVVKNLLIINAAVLFITILGGDYMYKQFALYYVGSDFFKPYQFITHMFMHGGTLHLIFNMYALMIFGSSLERVWGGEKFFFYYLVTGLGAAALHSGVLYLETASLMKQALAGSARAAMEYKVLMRTPTVGASGAVYGVLLGYGMLFPNNILRLIFPPIALKAKWFVLIFGAIELWLGLSQKGSNIAHFAHIGGMLFGLILIQYWKKNNRMYW